MEAPQKPPEMTVSWWEKEKEPVNHLTAFGILERWLLVGAFPNRQLTEPVGPEKCTREGYGHDFLTTLGGEEKAVLVLGASIPCDIPGDRKEMTVIPASARLNGIFDFRRFYKVTDDRVAYAFCYMDHDRDENVECDFGSDDSAKVWVNGALVHQIWTPARGCTPGSEHFQLPLKKGRNRIMVKIENYRGGWEFYMALYTPATASMVKQNLALFSSMRGHPPADAFSRQPFIDTFGQYKYADWPGKTADLAALRASRDADIATIEKDKGPGNWNTYGAWADGPTLEATGFFRTEKHKGKWWLVDPTGKLYFANGITCVNFGENTGLDGRESWFEDLPPANGEFSVCYSKQQGLHGYYAGKTTRTFDFARANLIRKYGPDWRNSYPASVHDRLRRWGINNIGGWSDQDIRMKRRTPYTVSLNTGGATVGGSSGYWRKFPDAFDPSFREALLKRLREEVGKSAGDPWCMGYFVDNELDWGNPDSLAIAALCSPKEQAAKLDFIGVLKGKYVDIARLNEAWGTEHASWDALLAHNGSPDRQRAANDLLEFSRRFAEAYFRTCREAVKEVAPNQLYLGCRFSHVHENHAMPAAVAARYCEVVSYNIYEIDLDKVVFPDPSDAPVLIGEFHFGALDRGMFHTGLRQVANQKERGESYYRYVRNAVAHPRIVGCHWFQFRDSPTSGRVIDGENYQIGFVDICDNPYAETTQAARRIGESLYE